MKNSEGHSHKNNLDYVQGLYVTLLGREADPEGLDYFVKVLGGGVPRDEVRNIILTSVEYLERNVYGGDAALLAVHASRKLFVQQLPAADVIVDLGGGIAGDDRGALVAMGYPHAFSNLSIVEPPPRDRHEIYKGIPDLQNEVHTEKGNVKYVYGSMTDLSMFASQSVDMVFSGETIEHVTIEECRTTLKEVRRILKDNGHFCLDTPNRAITRIKWPDRFINPDHKVEYYHHEMMKLLLDAGLKPMGIRGITHMPRTAASQKFIADEMIHNIGLHEDFLNCYLICYTCVVASV